MPTPAHAINNSIDTLGWPHTIIQGGRRKNSPRYSNWRSEVEQKIRGKGWLWKKDGGNQYDAFVLECVDLDDFPVSGASTIRRTQTDDTKPFHKALNELMLDCFKKVRESKNKRKRAIAREEIAAGSAAPVPVPDADDPEPKRARLDEGRPVILYVLDPGDATHRPQGEWHWDLPEVEKLAVLYESSIDELHVKFSSQLPAGRKVREIIGALADAAQDADAKQKPGRTTRIRSDDELDAFLRLTQAKPIKFLIILHKKPEDGNNTPPPQGMNADTYYFKTGRFDGPEYYDDPLEDSGDEITKRVGGKRGVPRKDHKFEERLNDIRRRIQRQQDLLASLEMKHKAAFPTAIHDADQGGDLRKKCYGTSYALTGAEVVTFRQVVADYLTDITTRTTADVAGALTVPQIEAAALAAIKADIDAGNYPGLPQTVP